MYRTDDVYGVTRELPLNYVERENVDGKFIECLSVDKHVIIYGSSKQGKTCLRKNGLQDEDFVLVQCQNTWGLERLAEAILKEAGFRVEVSTTRTIENRFKLLASFKTAVFGGEGQVGGEVEQKSVNAINERPLEIDPADPNDLVSALESVNFRKFVVLEDFHYLPKETQENYAFFLKTVHERSNITFIIVAVWREENRLILINGDLGGRIVSVDADAWTQDQLISVIEKGEDLLNIKFDDTFKAELVEASLGSVYIVQESCRRACHDAGVVSTDVNQARLQLERSASAYVADVVSESGARYQAFLTSFAGGFQDTDLEMYRWILYPVLTSTVDELEAGLRYRFIRETLERVHPRGASLNPGNVTQALISVPALQSRKNIKPFVLDYDQSELKLSVVDRGFLIWLSTIDSNELLDQLGIRVGKQA